MTLEEMGLMAGSFGWLCHCVYCIFRGLDMRPSLIISLLFIVFLRLAITPASAATLTPWEPGASPCAGACSLEWALEQTGAPAGETVPLTIPAGTPILWMSYARRGVPYGIQYYGRPTLRPLAAMGYPLGDGRWLVQIQECENMAIVWMPSGALSALLTEAGATEIAAPPASTPPGSTPPRVSSPPPPPVVVTVPPIVEPRDPPGDRPDDVTPVPLPAGIWLMLAALAGLGLIARKRR